MITSMHIENFKCFKDFDIDLGPFNVLIGPNDSGKTALLQAVGIALWVDERRCKECIPPAELGFLSKVDATWRNDPALQFRIDLRADSEGFGIGDNVLRIASLDDGRLIANVVAPSEVTITRTESWQPKDRMLHVWPGKHAKAGYYRLQPQSLRHAKAKFADEMSETGDGLSCYLDHINRVDSEAFNRLRDQFTARFPHYRRPKLALRGREDDKRPAIVFPTVHDEDLSAQSVSDGVMMSLAFIALAHQPEPPEVLLIEEPENCVHHASLKDILKTLQQLSDEKRVQVILTTHSPYLLDCVEPEEVHVFYKDEEGAVHSSRLSDHPETEALRKHFKTGEIWTGFESDRDIVEKTGGFE